MNANETPRPHGVDLHIEVPASPAAVPPPPNAGGDESRPHESADTVEQELAANDVSGVLPQQGGSSAAADAAERGVLDPRGGFGTSDGR